ncbi:MAG: hypothetical protein R3E95_22760 [Thiolinea sp.]
MYTAFKAAIMMRVSPVRWRCRCICANAPTRFMQQLDYGKGYRYAHDEADAYAGRRKLLSGAAQGRRYYEPVERGLEIKIREKLRRLRGS